MDKDLVENLRRANEASISLLTIMLATNRGEEAADIVQSDPVFAEVTTCMALAGIALSAIEALSELMGISPEEVLQTAGLNAAKYAMTLEELIEDEED